MISALLKDVLLSKKRKLIKRNFIPKLFVDNKVHDTFSKKGFVHLKNILNTDEVNNLIELFKQIKTKDTYEDTDFYFNTISFQDTEIRKLVIENTFKIIKPILPKFIDINNAQFPLGGNFCISPAKATRGCGLHQDPTLVDETESYSMTIWIPLTNTNIENGCLHFVAGSHLWANYHRSMSIKSAFDDYMGMLWNHAKPVIANVGDVICFDTSILHGSTVNTTNDVRLAVNIPILPKETQMKNYFPANSILNNKAERYNIDENYFIKESQYNKPSSNYKLDKIVDLDNFYTLKNIKELLQETSAFIDNSENLSD